MCDFDPVRLKQLALIEPAEILGQATALRERSSQCSDLAADSLTDEGRMALTQMARELKARADELEETVVKVRQLFTEAC